MKFFMSAQAYNLINLMMGRTRGIQNMHKKIRATKAAVNRYCHRYGQQMAEKEKTRLLAMTQQELVEFLNSVPAEMVRVRK